MHILNRPGSAVGALVLGVTTALTFGFCPLPPAHAQQQAARQTVALPNSVLDVTTRATALHHDDSTEPRHVTICLKFPHPDQAQAYADAVSNPNSPLFRQFLTPEEIGERFGPAQADYDAIVTYLKAGGMTITNTPVNRMTVAVTGTAPQIEATFGVKINVYQESQLDRFHRAGRNAPARTFFSNDRPAQLPANLAPMVNMVAGLENYVRPVPLHGKLKSAHRSTAPYVPAAVRTAYNLAPLYSAGNTGSGRTIGISNWDGFSLTSAGDFVTAFSLPTPLSGGKPTNITVETVDNGSSVTAEAAGEGDLDQQMNLGQAPLASIIVYAGTWFDDPSFTYAAEIDVLAQEVSDNKVDIATESYGWPLTSSYYASAHTQHLMMTMQGITYLCASGDDGSDWAGLDYPFTDSEILVVGGTVLTLNSSNQWTSEVGWGGTSGGTPYGSGGGVYESYSEAPHPVWQTGRGVPASSYRVFPDVALHASGNNSDTAGAYDFYTGGREASAEGTSFASPVTCGSLAVVEQYLIGKGVLPANSAGKQRLGRVNDVIYGFNGRNDIFHDITSGNNGAYSCTAFWDYVTGWGSFNFANLAAGLIAPLAVNVTPQGPTVNVGNTLPLTATVTGSNVTTVTWALTSGPGSVSATGVYSAPASVTTTQMAVVTATSTINTATPVSGSTTITIPGPVVTISGTITLTGCLNSAQPLTFQLQSTSNLSSITTMNATLTSTGAGAATGTYTLSNVPAGTYNVAIKGAKWLQAVVMNVNATTAASGINATLLPGDMNGDNVIDLKDFSVLSSEYGQSGSSLVGDLNCDGVVDLKDFSLFSAYYGKAGQSLP